jgi:hypothetical protein
MAVKTTRSYNPKLCVAFVALLGSLLVITGCSKGLRLTLINNTGSELRVKLGSREISIGQGDSGVVKYPQSNNNWTLMLVVQNHHYRYTFPKKLDGYPWAVGVDAGVHAQVETDGSIHLVAPSVSGSADLRNGGEIAVPGFPIVTGS